MITQIQISYQVDLIHHTYKQTNTSQGNMYLGHYLLHNHHRERRLKWKSLFTDFSLSNDRPTSLLTEFRLKNGTLKQDMRVCSRVNVRCQFLNVQPRMRNESCSKWENLIHAKLSYIFIRCTTGYRCHGRVSGRTRETRGKVNKGNFNNRTQDTPLCRRENRQRLRGNSGLINT